MQRVVQALKEQKATISVAESLTGGLFSSKIAEVENASAVFIGGIVAYTRFAKEQLLGIEPMMLEQQGMISSSCVVAMATQIKKICKSDYAIAFSGNAGPSAWEEKPIGCVYTAISTPTHVLVFEDLLTGNRNEIREQVCNLGIERLVKELGMK